MPITLLDVILLVVMLVSALLAMVRGFMREVLSIASWAAAALVTVWAYPKLKPIAQQYFTNDIVASGAAIGVAFLGTLLIVSVITIKISDMILDSRIGALDRTIPERRKLSFAGVISIAVALDEKGELAGDPEVALIGLPLNAKDGTPFDDIVADAVEDLIEGKGVA